MSGPSLHPQKIDSWVWYYENKRSIEIIIDAERIKHFAQTGTAMSFTIPKGKLKKSLARMESK